MESLQRKPEVSRLPFLEVVELTLTDSPIAGRSLKGSQIRERFGVTVVLITRVTGETLVNPPADTILHSGDKLRVLGLSEQIEAFKDQATTH